EQRVAHLRQLVVELVPQPCGQERDGFDEALDVRVLAAIGVEREPAGDLRVLGGELAAQLAEIAELALEVRAQLLAHFRPRPPAWSPGARRGCRRSRARAWGRRAGSRRSGSAASADAGSAALA